MQGGRACNKITLTSINLKTAVDIASTFIFYLFFLNRLGATKGRQGRDGAEKYIPRLAEFRFLRAAPALPPPAHR